MIDQAKRQWVRDRSGGCCVVCKMPKPLDGPPGVRGEVAHKVAKTTWTLRRYGEEAIDHTDNLEWTCAGHNSAVLITFKPVEREALMARIREKVRDHG